MRSTEEQTKGEGKEILIGNTNRPQSADVLGSIDGHGYAIVVKGDKIVINGTTPLLTTMAVDYFIATYLSTPAEEVEVEKTVVSDMAMMELTTEFKIVYDNALDDTTSKNGKGELQNVYAGENKPYNYDFPVYAAMQLAKPIITSTTGLKLSIEDDTLKLPKEILIGNTCDRDELREFNAKIDVYQYGLAIKNNKIMLTAQNDTNLRSGLNLLECVMKDSTIKDGDNKKTLLPAEFSTIVEGTNPWVTDFPRPTAENVSLTGSTDVGDGSHLFIYSGSGIGVKAFTDYCASLEAAGYARYMQNAAEGSEFITFFNAEKKHVLHVIYAAYKYASPLYANINTVTKSIRITSESSTRVNMLPTNLLTQDFSSYTKKLNSRITAVSLNWMPGVDNPAELQDPDRGYGNAYIITLEDGSFVVIDGGFYTKYDESTFYSILLEIYREAFGANKMPSPEDPIRISAWIMTHDHGDHSGLFNYFVKNYCTTGTITIDYVLGNLASNEEMFNAVDSSVAVRGIVQGNTLGNLPHATKYVKVHTGQKFYIANCAFEVIGTHEDVFPNRIERFNDTTTVIRTTLTHTDGNGNASANSATTAMWLGDAETKESAPMVATFGDYLESDFVQMSHHAGGGTTYTLYRYVLGTGEDSKGKVVLVPQSRVYYADKIAEYANSTAERGWGCTVQVVNNDSVQYIIISDDDYNATVVIDENGANMEMKSNSNPTGVYGVHCTKAFAWVTRPGSYMAPTTGESLHKKY